MVSIYEMPGFPAATTFNSTPWTPVAYNNYSCGTKEVQNPKSVDKTTTLLKRKDYSCQR